MAVPAPDDGGDRVTAPIRVVVVLDTKAVAVHGVTCDGNEAIRWVQELGDKYGDRQGAAQVYVGTVRPKEGQ